MCMHCRIVVCLEHIHVHALQDSGLPGAYTCAWKEKTVLSHRRGVCALAATRAAVQLQAQRSWATRNRHHTHMSGRPARWPLHACSTAPAQMKRCAHTPRDNLVWRCRPPLLTGPIHLLQRCQSPLLTSPIQSAPEVWRSKLANW